MTAARPKASCCRGGRSSGPSTGMEPVSLYFVLSPILRPIIEVYALFLRHGSLSSCLASVLSRFARMRPLGCWRDSALAFTAAQICSGRWSKLKGNLILDCRDIFGFLPASGLKMHDFYFNKPLCVWQPESCACARLHSSEFTLCLCFRAVVSFMFMFEI